MRYPYRLVILLVFVILSFIDTIFYYTQGAAFAEEIVHVTLPLFASVILAVVIYELLQRTID